MAQHDSTHQSKSKPINDITPLCVIIQIANINLMTSPTDSPQ